MVMFFSLLVFFSFTITQDVAVSDKEYALLPPVFDADNFDRCLLFEDEALYCFVEYHLKPLDPKNTSKTWNNIQELSDNEKNYRHDHLRHGVCIPLACPNITIPHDDPAFRQDLASCLNKKYEHMGIYGTIEQDYCQTTEPPNFDFFDFTVAFFTIAYILFVLSVTYYDYSSRYRRTPEEYKRIFSTQRGKVFSCFSLIKNWERFTTVDWTPENVRCRSLQGFRFYNMCIIIFLHTIMMFIIGPVTNTKFVENLYHNPAVIVLASGPYGVFTFFIVSALLLTINLKKEFDENSKKELNLKTVLLIIIYRYIRLTPCVAVILLFHSTILYHAGAGPWWDDYMGIDRRNCRENGWTNLLYLNNWINPSRMCLIETWYLSVDMQNFILVLILLYFTLKNPRRFWKFLIVGWIVNIFFMGWHLYRKQLYHFFSPNPENLYKLSALFEEDGVWINSLTYPPMNLAGSFFGTAAGYLAYKFNKVDWLSSPTMHFIWHTSVYGVALGIIILPGMWIFSDNYYDSYWFSIPYLTLSPTIYSMAITIGLMGVSSGHGWVTKYVLEWPPIYYIGRISYTTYLAHYCLLFYELASRRYLISIDPISILFDFARLLSLSLLFGLVLSLMVEYPTSALSSLYLKKKFRKPEDEDNIKNEIMNGTNNTDIKQKTS
ncbi:nose resistant to fluoxetine protein 6-like [Harmonia axyridis]|uniref:nose resistant to fluoxetine protein 6-like n=1 Tax=Harmonia axyridis TaxID=115357 RepID=UPI001E275451|nr:nose resistant to fluoxetine protein 6-like [Harmonia axyridis]